MRTDRSPDPCPIGMRGIVPSLHTPFDADGAIDEIALHRLVDRTVSAGCAGMLVGAVAGEVGSLTASERRRLAETVVERANVPVVVAVSAETAAVRLAAARMAREAGATWMLCQTPAGIAGTALRDAFAELAEAGPPNLMIQDLSWSDGGMALDDILHLFEDVPSFRALKIETVPSGPKYTDVLRATEGRLHVSGGWAILQMIDAMKRGVHALMPSAMDALYVEIWRRFHDGDEHGARSLFEAILPVLAFTQQRLELSIDFFKRLRVAEGIFATARRRSDDFPPDDIQAEEMDLLIARVLELQKQVASA